MTQHANNEPLELRSNSLRGLRVTVEASALVTLQKHHQTESRNEAGGLIFAKFKGGNVTVVCVSAPSPLDRRSRFGFQLNEINAKRKIKQMYRSGYHYIGDWHSHPQVNPTPSLTDISTIRSAFKESKHTLNYFMFLILSNTSVNQSYFAMTDGEKEYRLHVYDS